MPADGSRRRRPPSKDVVKAVADRAEKRARGEDPFTPSEEAKFYAEEPAPSPPPVREEEIGRGRPTDFKPEYVQQVNKLCQLGATDTELADFFDVSVRTIYRWKLDHEDFCQAIQSGKDLADERVVRGMYQRAVGYGYVEQQAFKLKVSRDVEKIEVVDVEKHMPPDTQAGSFWLRNRRPKEWQEKTSQQVTADGTVVVEHRGDLDEARRVAFALGRAFERSKAAPKTIEHDDE